MITKKILSGALAAVMILSLCACGNSDERAGSSAGSSSAVSEISQEPAESSKPESSRPESSSQASSKPRVTSEISYAPLPDADTSVITDYDKKYFVKRLDHDQLYYFTEIYKAATQYKNKVRFDRPIEDSKLNALMFLLNYDCPELIHLTGDYYPEYTDETMYMVSGLKFSYCLSQKEYASDLKQLEDYFAELEKKLSGKTDTEKERYIYDLIFDNCQYNEQNKLSGSVYGVLIKHIGRCEGFCKTIMWTMRRLSVECLCISGQQSWSETAIYSEHSWNLIKLDGEWYNLDITVDNIKSPGKYDNPPCYGFYNVTDSFVSQSRDINQIYIDLGIPQCTSDKLNYHIQNGLLLKSGSAGEEEIDKLLEKHFTENGIDDLSIKFESENDYNNAVTNIDTWINNFMQNHSGDDFEHKLYYNSLSDTIAVKIYKKS